jgi:hypothetical protein
MDGGISIMLENHKIPVILWISSITEIWELSISGWLGDQASEQPWKLEISKSQTDTNRHEREKSDLSKSAIPFKCQLH